MNLNIIKNQDMKKQTLLLGLLFAAFSLMAQVPNYVPANGLVGWWPFTGNANDLSGNGNNGTVNGAILTTDRNGTANSAYSFSSAGCATRIDAAINTNTIQNGFTLAFWLLRAGNGCGSPRIMEFWSGTNGNGTLAYAFHGNSFVPGLDYYTSTTYINNATIGYNSVNNNQWVHIAFTCDGTSAKCYQDGVLINTFLSTGNAILAGNAAFGRMNHPAFDAFNGKLDDIGIWNRALTQQEITNIFNAVNCTPLTATITPSGSITFCAGNSVTLTAGGGNTYSWSNGSSNQSITISNGATYTVTVTDANNCTATASQVVTVNSLPGNGVNVSGNTTFCSGGSVTLTAQGTGTYLWSNSATNKSITVNQGGSYTVTVTSANNCTASSAPVNVTVNQTPTAGISAGGLTAFCQGGSVVLTASGGGSYNWNTGSSSQSITVTNGATYTVTVSNGNCTASATQNVTVYPTPSVSINPLPTFVSNNAQPIPLSGTPAGGSYSGSGVSGSQFNPATAGLGSRSVTYTYNSPNNCTGSATTTTVVYDTTGTVCTDYDTVTTTIYDTTYVSLTTTDTLLIDFATGIAPPNNTNTLKVYPNPAKDHLIINNGNLSAMTGYSIKVTNALGQIVFNQPVNQQQFYIDLSTWGGSGVYVLYVLDSQQNLKETKQIVLQ
jgi:hypothetical protein